MHAMTKQLQTRQPWMTKIDTIAKMKTILAIQKMQNTMDANPSRTARKSAASTSTNRHHRVRWWNFSNWRPCFKQQMCPTSMHGGVKSNFDYLIFSCLFGTDCRCCSSCRDAPSSSSSNIFGILMKSIINRAAAAWAIIRPLTTASDCFINEAAKSSIINRAAALLHRLLAIDCDPVILIYKAAYASRSYFMIVKKMTGQSERALMLLLKCNLEAKSQL